MKYDFEIDMESQNAMSLVLQRVKPQTRILEFGPATGYMTRYMKEILGCRIWGVEIDPEAAAQAAAYTEDIVIGDADALAWLVTYKGKKFDHILFVDVLEHLRNPLLVLQTAKELLAPDGTILISVPNIAHNAVILELLQGRFNYQKTGLLDDTHIHFFTRDSLATMVRQSGLSVTAWETTEACPEDTEFGCSYDQVPENIESLLRQRMEGHIYQWIIEVKETPREEQPKLLNGLVDDELQLFYGPSDTWNEEASLRRPLSLAAEGTEYAFSFTWTGHGELRLDPGNKPAFCELSQARLVCEDGSVIFPDIAAAGDLVVLQATEEKWTLLSFGIDPQIRISTEKLAGQQQQVELRFSLKVKRSVNKGMSPLLADFVSQYKPDLGNIGVLLAALRKDTDKWQEEAHIWRHETERLQKDIQRKDNEIQRKDNEMDKAQEMLQDAHSQMAKLHEKIYLQNVELAKLQNWQNNLLLSKGWRWGSTLPFLGKRLFPQPK